MNKFDQISEVINKRQSIYPVSFTGESIPNEMIMKILANANQAPNHKHTEPWRFHIISGNAKKQYTTFAQDSYKNYVSPDKFKQSKYDKLAKKINLSSHVIMIGCHHDKKSNLPEWEEIAAVSCAVQNIYLSVSAAGLGGYWSSPRFIINNVDKYFDIADDEVCLGLFYLGIPKNNLPPPISKGGIDDKVKWYD